MPLRHCALFLLIALAVPIAAHGDTPPQPIPADGKCAVPVDPNWTKQEQFIWLNVCIGKAADFNKAPGYGGDLDPKSAAGLPESRIVRSSFLETILLKDKYRSALTRLGVRITGARFSETVDLRNAELEHDLWLDRSLLENGVNLETAKTSRQITFDRSKIVGTFNAAGIQTDETVSAYQAEFLGEINLLRAHIGNLLFLSGSTVAGKLDMNGIRVDQGLLMRDEAQFKDIDLSDAHIGGQVDLSGAKLAESLAMNGISVDQDLFLRGAQFKDIDLTAAHIGGQIDLSNSTVASTLKMDGIRIDRALLMQQAQFKDINLIGAHVGGQIVLSGSTVAGQLQADYIDVEGAMFLGNGATFTDEIGLPSAKLGQDLRLSGGTFNKDVNLTRAQIGGVLGLEAAQWPANASLNLTDAAAGAIDLSDSWPVKTSLNGFTYRNLSNISQTISEQAEPWFGKQAYAPQPYEQLAGVLQANGLIDDATAIRYAGKERERRAASGLSWAWLFLLNYSIGFGYHLEYAFAWALGFMLLGWAILYATGQRTKHGTTLGLTYSFDMLLPLVQLDKKHDDVDLDPWPQRYFYLHKIVGVILTSFIVAGISGLTK